MPEQVLASRAVNLNVSASNNRFLRPSCADSKVNAKSDHKSSVLSHAETDHPHTAGITRGMALCQKPQGPRSHVCGTTSPMWKAPPTPETHRPRDTNCPRTSLLSLAYFFPKPM